MQKLPGFIDSIVAIAAGQIGAAAPAWKTRSPAWIRRVKIREHLGILAEMLR